MQPLWSECGDHGRVFALPTPIVNAPVHLSCNPAAKCSIVCNLQTHAKYFITKVPLVNVPVDLSTFSTLSVCLIRMCVHTRARARDCNRGFSFLFPFLYNYLGTKPITKCYRISLKARFPLHVFEWYDDYV